MANARQGAPTKVDGKAFAASLGAELISTYGSELVALLKHFPGVKDAIDALAAAIQNPAIGIPAGAMIRQIFEVATTSPHARRVLVEFADALTDGLRAVPAQETQQRLEDIRQDLHRRISALVGAFKRTVDLPQTLSEVLDRMEVADAAAFMGWLRTSPAEMTSHIKTTLEKQSARAAVSAIHQIVATPDHERLKTAEILLGKPGNGLGAVVPALAPLQRLLETAPKAEPFIEAARAQVVDQAGKITEGLDNTLLRASQGFPLGAVMATAVLVFTIVLICIFR